MDGMLPGRNALYSVPNNIWLTQHVISIRYILSAIFSLFLYILGTNQ